MAHTSSLRADSQSSRRSSLPARPSRFDPQRVTGPGSDTAFAFTQAPSLARSPRPSPRTALVARVRFSSGQPSSLSASPSKLAASVGSPRSPLAASSPVSVSEPCRPLFRYTMVRLRPRLCADFSSSCTRYVRLSRPISSGCSLITTLGNPGPNHHRHLLLIHSW